MFHLIKKTKQNYSSNNQAPSTRYFSPLAPLSANISVSLLIISKFTLFSFTVVGQKQNSDFRCIVSIGALCPPQMPTN